MGIGYNPGWLCPAIQWPVTSRAGTIIATRFTSLLNAFAVQSLLCNDNSVEQRHACLLPTGRSSQGWWRQDRKFFFCKNETNSNFINEIFYGKNNNNIARKPYRLAARTPLGAYSAPLWATLAPQEPIPQFSVLSGLELSPLSGIGPQSTWPIM